MALRGPIPISFDQIFPYGCYAVGEVEPVKDFEASSNGRFVQARDKQTGELVWQIAVMDADPSLKAAQKTVAVKILAPAQPVHRPRWQAAVHAGRVRRADRDSVRQRVRKARLLHPGSGDARSSRSCQGREQQGGRGVTEQPYTYLSMSIDPGEQFPCPNVALRLHDPSACLGARFRTAAPGPGSRRGGCAGLDNAERAGRRQGPRIACGRSSPLRRGYLADCERMHAEHAQVTDRRPDTKAGPLELPFRRPLGSPLHADHERTPSLMFKKLPGDEARNLVSTTPDTAVVFRPAVVNTPAILTLIILAWTAPRRALSAWCGGTRSPWPWRRTVAACWLYGWHVTVAAVCMTTSALTALGAASTGPRSPGWSAGGCWPGGGWVWVYRRHWQPVMVVSGLGRHLRGRDYLPRAAEGPLRRLGRPGHRQDAQRPSGQGLDRPRRPSGPRLRRRSPAGCRVARAGRLRLTFPRRDPLAVPLPAIPIPETASVGPVEIGKLRGRHPCRLKVHGTHVLIAGATGAGKGSILWSVDPWPAARGASGPGRRSGRWIPSDGAVLRPGPVRDRYAADPADCADLLEAAVAVMQRARRPVRRGPARAHTPTVEDPFVLVVVDEVAFLTAYQSDKHLRPASPPPWPRSPPRAARSASASWPRSRTRARRS